MSLAIRAISFMTCNGPSPSRISVLATDGDVIASATTCCIPVTVTAIMQRLGCDIHLGDYIGVRSRPLVVLVHAGLTRADCNRHSIFGGFRHQGVDWLIDWSIGWLVGWLVGWSDDWLIY